MINGDGKMPPRSRARLNRQGLMTDVAEQSPLLKRQFTPRDLDEVNLTKLNHAEWLEEFSQILSLSTGVAMTPKREGTITRLYWAAKYVRLLEKTLKRQNEQMDKLKSEVDHDDADTGR